MASSTESYLNPSNESRELSASEKRAVNTLAGQVRDILLDREARCLLDRISYKLELSGRYGTDDPEYVSSLRELAAALERTLRFDTGGCL